MIVAFRRYIGGLKCAAGLMLGLLSLATAGAQPRPNVLLILGDDMTYTDLGSFGNGDVHTPHLDRLARQGMRLRQVFNTAPMCAPTRMSLYTGLYPVRHGGYPNHSRVYDGIRSLPHYLEPLGYRVALIGKRHEAPLDRFPFEFLGGKHGDDGEGIDLDLFRVRAFMEESREKPWLLVVASNQPHAPWTRGDRTLYDPDQIGVPPYLVDTPETRRALAAYYTEISYLDQQAGMILSYLSETGQEENTLVLFLGEQGSSLPHAKWTCYDTGLRSAAIARWPGRITPGSESDALISYVDVLPTFIELAGGNPEGPGFDGSSFLKVLLGETDRHHPYVFGVQTSRGIYSGPEAYGIRTVRDDRYRLIWNLNWQNEFSNTVIKGQDYYQSWKEKGDAGDPYAAWRYRWYQNRPEYELYDLAVDPFELHNLAEILEYQNVFARLLPELTAWMRSQKDEGTATEAAALSRQP